MAADTPEEVGRTRRRSQVAFIAGVILLVIAVIGTLTSLLPDVLATVAGILGVAGIVYGLATGVLVALNVFDRDPPA